MPRVIEATLIPLALFYAALWSLGPWAGLLAALAWSYAALLRRLVIGQRVSGLLALGVVGLTARTAVAFATRSLFIYFLQPTVTTVAVAGAFLLSVPAGRPLAQRLATDFFPLDPEVLGRRCVQRVFARITLLWAFVNLANAGVTVWLLLSRPIADYLALKTVASAMFLLGGVALSSLWFRATLRRHDAGPVLVTMTAVAGDLA
jgi:hypothetical protein